MMSSNAQAPDDHVLRRYLVGSLSEDETERLDELSVADDQFAARLRAVENDLVDAYVNGELSGETLQRFKTQYLSSPAMRDKVAFAETLLGYQQRVGTAAPREARAFAVPLLMPRWALAAAALLFLGGSGYLILESSRLRREGIDARAARAALEAREQQLQRQVAEERSANAETARALAQAREVLAQRPGAAQASRPSTRPVIAAFVLLPPRRGAGDIPTLAIPPGTQAVTLHVDLESDDFPSYRAEVNDPVTARIIWRNSNLRAASRDSARSLTVTLDGALLKPQTYTVDVTGIPARGASETVGSYPFRVVLQ